MTCKKRFLIFLFIWTGSYVLLQGQVSYQINSSGNWPVVPFQSFTVYVDGTSVYSTSSDLGDNINLANGSGPLSTQISAVCGNQNGSCGGSGNTLGNIPPGNWQSGGGYSIGNFLKILITPLQADQPGITAITSGASTTNMCAGDQYQITTANKHPNTTEAYYFEAVDENGVTKESFTFNDFFSDTPTWTYTVPSWASNSQKRKFRVTIKAQFSGVVNGPVSTETSFSNIYQPAPTAVISPSPPTCKGGGDGSFSIVLTGYRGQGGIDGYGLSIQNSSGTNFPFAGSKTIIGINGTTAIANINITASDMFNPLIANSYKIQVKNYYSGVGNQCFNTYNFIIPAPYSSFTVSASPVVKSPSQSSHTTCSPGNDGQISASNSMSGNIYGNSPNGNYSILGGNYASGTTQSNPTPAMFQGGNSVYKVYALDNKGCVSDNYQSVTINSPPALTLSPVVLTPYTGQNISCFGSSDGSIQLTAGGGSGVGNYTFQLLKSGFSTPGHNVSAANTTFSALGAGTYTATAIDFFNCSVTATNITVTEPSAVSITGFNRPKDFSTIEYNGYDVSCHLANDGHIQVLASGGTTDIANPYSFAGNNLVYTITGGSQVFTANPHFRSLPQQVPLIFYVKDANGCTTSAGITLDIIPSALSVTGKIKQLYNGFNINCNNNANILNNGIVNNGRITVSGAGGVYNLSYNFSVDGGNFYYPTTPTGYYANTFTSLTTGTHNFGIQDNNGCIIADTFWLNEPPRLRLKTYDPHAPACKGYTDGYLNFAAKGGVPTFYNYTLSGQGLYYYPPLYPDYLKSNIQQNLTSFTGIRKDNYDLQIMDDNLCTFDTMVVIGEPDLLAINTLLGFIPCKGEQAGNIIADVSGGTMPYTYIWSPDPGQTITTVLGTAATITGLPKNQTYYLHLTDANNCSNNGNGQQYLVKAVTLVEPADSIRLSCSLLSMPLCNGQSNGAIKITPTGGWGNYSYSTDNVTFSGSGLVRDLPKGIYTVYVKDRFNCLKDTTFDLGEPDLLSIQADKHDVQCFQSKNGIIVLTATGGTIPFNYQVSVTGLGSVNRLITFSGLDIGSYHPFITDFNNCTVAGTMLNITQPGLLQLALEKKDATCGQPTGSASVTVTGGTIPYQYLWSNTVSTTTQISQVLSGNYGIVATDCNLCQVSGTAIIVDRDGPIVSGMLISGTSCSYTADGKASIQVVTIPGYKTVQAFEWKTTNNSQTISSITSTATGLSGNQSVTGIVIDSDGCRGASIIYIPSPDPIRITLKGIDPLCHNDKNGSINSVITGGTQPYQYAWDDSLKQTSENALNIPGYKVMGDTVATYQLALIDKNNCVADESTHLINPAKVVVDIPDSSVVCVGQSVTLDAQNPTFTHQWTSDNGFSSTDRQISISNAGLYKITVINAKGCIAKDSFRLRTSTALLNAEFANIDTLYVSDTLRLAEISWPAPDSVIWNFPPGISRLVNDQLNVKYKDKEYVYIIATDTGRFEITLNAYLGQCADLRHKTIQVEPYSKKYAAGGRWGIQGIRSYKLFPNPTNTTFRLEVELTDNLPLEVTIYHGITTQVVASKQNTNNLYHIMDFDLGEYPPGMYITVISSNSQRKIVKVIKE